MSLAVFAFFKCLGFLSVSVAVCVYSCYIMWWPMSWFLNKSYILVTDMVKEWVEGIIFVFCV